MQDNDTLDDHQMTESIEQRLSVIENKLDQIAERNKRVECDKAWEISKFRIATITLMTYCVTAIAFYFISVQNLFLSAVITAIGYYLSTLSLPLIKAHWVKKRRL